MPGAQGSRRRCRRTWRKRPVGDLAHDRGRNGLIRVPRLHLDPVGLVNLGRPFRHPRAESLRRALVRLRHPG